MNSFSIQNQPQALSWWRSNEKVPQAKQPVCFCWDECPLSPIPWVKQAQGLETYHKYYI